MPVALAAIERGELSARRTLPGSLEASSRIEVTTTVSGRLAELAVDLGDPVQRGQVVARLDRDELAQAVRQAEAEVAVAEASVTEARLRQAQGARDLERGAALQQQAAIAEAELDALRTTAQGRDAALAVAEAQATAARAALRAARARLEDAVLTATWTGDDPQRVVAERLVDEGSVVAANTRLLTLVDLDPLRAVVHVTERDLGALAAGQPVTLRTDAWPGETFPARVDRIAPVFDPASRQARVELAVPNPDGRLRPGLFVTAEVVTDTAKDAWIVPADALVRRDGQPVIFVVDPGADAARLVPVQPGLQDAGRVQLTPVEGALSTEGRVVVLGQQLLGDGAAVVVPPEAP